MSDPRAGDDDGRDPDGGEPTRRRRKHRSWARRKHLGLITTGVALLVLVVGVLSIVLTWDSGRTPLSQQAAALDTGSATPTAPTGPAASGSTPTTVATPVNVTVRGIVATIGDGALTVTTPTKLTYNVRVTADTQFKRNAGFSTFAAGDAVVVKGPLAAGVITATNVSKAT